MQTPTATDPRLPRHEASGNHVPTYGENHVAEERTQEANPIVVLADDRCDGIYCVAGSGGETMVG